AGSPVGGGGGRPAGYVGAGPWQVPFGPGGNRGVVGPGGAGGGGGAAGGLADQGAGARRRPPVPGRGRGRGGAGQPPRPFAAGRSEGGGVMTGRAGGTTQAGGTLVPLGEALTRYEPVIGLEVHVQLRPLTNISCRLP